MYEILKITDIKDFDAVMIIENSAFLYPWSLELLLQDFLHHPYSEYYKLVVGEEIVGYFGLWIVGEFSQITTFAIKLEKQGLGYGKAMLDYLIKTVTESNCQNITLEVRTTNVKAIKLYEKAGFYKVTVRKRYYENGEDAYLMKLDL
mgnify:CR=1 FL=1